MKQLPQHLIIATLAVSGLSLTGCATPPAPTNVQAGSTFKGCMVTDVNGIADRSFNQLTHEGMKRAVEQHGGTVSVATSRSDDAYAPNVASLVDQKCDLIVGVGFNLVDAIRESAKSNPSIHYAIVDDDSIDLPNVRPITFRSDQASFLAGYAAAGYSKTKVVGTFGGQQIPPVTLFMDGFSAGVDYYNQQHKAAVKVVGWNQKTQTGSFTGGFESNETAKTTAASLIDQNADVILPVGGPIFIAAGEAVRDSRRAVSLVGVDIDIASVMPDRSDLFLTSILKEVDRAVDDVTASAIAGKFDAAPYIGTLKNEAVGLAPFHAFQDKVEPSFRMELDELKAAIISGSVEVSTK